jgi:peptidoglycan hydrolase-like protein with peptidoglycan-binding domain
MENILNIYTSLDEVPFDELPDGYLDGDNSILKDYPDGEPLENLVKMYAAPPKTRNLVVPYTRELRLRLAGYMQGEDILAVSRALVKAGFRKWDKRTSVFGPGMKKNIQEFQDNYGLKPDGVYGLETHKKLARFFDEYGAFLMTRKKKILSFQDPRDVILAYAIFGYNNRNAINYTQGPSRMYGVRHKLRPPAIPTWEDCSSFSTWCYWGAGVPDPNGLGYNGYGYTGTLSRNGERTSSPKKGDLAFYGYGWPYNHVVVYIGEGRCISHGSNIGPLLLNVYYRPLNHFRTYIGV